MKSFASSLALAAALAGSAAAGSEQLARSAGLSPSEASTLSLSDLAAFKFNRDARQSDYQPIGTGAGAGPVVKGGRTAAFLPAQLVTAAGLEPEEAGDLGLSELAALKFNRDAAAGDRQSVRNSAAAPSEAIVWELGDGDN